MPGTKQLTAVVDEGNRVLKHLLKAGDSLKKKKLTPESLEALKGVVLLHSRKAAAVLGYEGGSGVAYNVLGHEADGSPRLSAPVPIKLSKMGLGLQLGYNNIYTMMAVFNQSQMDMLISSHAGTIVGNDLDVAGVPFMSEGRSSLHRTSMNTLEQGAEHPEDKIKIISVSDSFMLLDCSLYGGSLTMDDELMQVAYGEDMPALSVLHGKVATPPALAVASERIAAGLLQLANM